MIFFNMSQLNLPHGTNNKWKTETLKSKKTDMLRSKVNSLGNPCSQSGRRKEGYGVKDLQKSNEWNERESG